MNLSISVQTNKRCSPSLRNECQSIHRLYNSRQCHLRGLHIDAHQKESRKGRIGHFRLDIEQLLGMILMEDELVTMILEIMGRVADGITSYQVVTHKG